MKSKKVLESIASEKTSGVFVVRDVIAKLNLNIVNELKSHANKNPRKKSRLLLHQDIEDSLHQMVIVHSKAQYIRPHKNIDSAKSWQVVEGQLIFVRFTDSGDLIDHVFMGAYQSGNAFLVRLSESFYHTLIPLTDKTVIVETILGPFRGTTYAPWAPSEDDKAESGRYFNQMCLNLGVNFKNHFDILQDYVRLQS